MTSLADIDISVIPPWRRWLVQWDFSHNAIPLAFFAFTSMCQTAAQHFGNMSPPETLWFVFYAISCVILAASIIIIVLRAIVFPSAIVTDFNHPRLVNFFFLPVMIGALCVLTTPSGLRSVAQFTVGFYILSAYQVMLTLYLYGEWLFGRQPTNFIHPLVFMQTIGFFLLANIGATAHLVDQAWFMFSVGCLFWLLVFITNFQHVAFALDKQCERPQPTFFLFIAPPAQAAIAVVVLEAASKAAEQPSFNSTQLLTFDKEMVWSRFAQSFHYIDLFIYLLMFRLFPAFWTTQFAISWWAYIFPLSAAAATTIWRYKAESGLFWAISAGVLSIIACTAMAVVLLATIWALAQRKVPYNENALIAYYRRYSARHLVVDGFDQSMA